jgi:hypothetical protein
MLHREQGRRGAGRDPDLAVGVLDVAVGGLDRDPERPRHLLGLQAARQHRDHLGLALGEPRRPLDSRYPLAGRLDHRGDRIGVEPAAACLLAQGLHRPLWRERLAVRPRLTHRLVGVGGGEHPGGQGELGAAAPAVVARAVEALVVGAGNGRKRGQERGAGEDALGVIRVEAHLFPLVGAQRPGLLPGAGADRNPPEVMDERRAPERFRVVDAATQRRRAGQLGHSG